MLRVTRLTDYATVLMTRMARDPERNASAVHLAAESDIPVATVTKLLKLLNRAGLVQSLRGVNGGYGLARAPAAISVADVVAAIEGPVALTACAVGKGNCEFEKYCITRGNWQLISRAVQTALEAVSIKDMAAPVARPIQVRTGIPHRN